MEFLFPVRCSEHPATLLLSCHSPKWMHFPVCPSQIPWGTSIQKENHKKISKETFCRVTLECSAWTNNALGLFAGSTALLTQPVKQTKGISKTNTVFTKMFHKFSDWLYTLFIHQSPRAESAEIHMGVYGFTRNLQYLLTLRIQRYETASPHIYEHGGEYIAAEKYSHQLSAVPLLFESKFKSLDGLKKKKKEQPQ